MLFFYEFIKNKIWKIILLKKLGYYFFINFGHLFKMGIGDGD